MDIMEENLEESIKKEGEIRTGMNNTRAVWCTSHRRQCKTSI
jgi:hypothetical protein